MRRAGSLTVGFLLALAVSVLIYADCLPTTTGTFMAHGTIAGRTGATGPTSACAPGNGWQGVIKKVATPVGANPGTLQTTVFLASTAAGGNINHLYVGLHVDGDQAFTTSDVAVVQIDANNSKSFDTGDLAVRVTAGASVTPATGEKCDTVVPAARITCFRFAGGVWGPVGTCATAKTSHDYTTVGDAETEIWELELDITPSTVGTTISAAAGKVGVGAKVFIDTPNMEPVAFSYPADFVTDADPNLLGAGQGVDAAKHEVLDIGKCTPDVVLWSIDGTDHKNVSGHITTYAGAVDLTKPSHFKAELRLVGPGPVPGMTPLDGQIKFRGLPYAAGVQLPGFDIVPDLAAQPTAKFTPFDQVGDIRTVSFAWPTDAAQYGPAKIAFAQLAGGRPVDHACLVVSLSGFNVNSDTSNDVRQQNLTFTELSTVEQDFYLKGGPQIGKDKKGEYRMRARWVNVPAAAIDNRGRKPKPGFWHFRVTDRLTKGIKDLGNGWYRIRLTPDQQKHIEVVMSGGAMPNPTQQIVLSPKAGGQAFTPSSGEAPFTVPAPAGSTVSIYATGTITVDTGAPVESNGPDGFNDQVRAHERERLPNTRAFMAMAAQPRTFRSAYAAYEHVGALVGSFDRFKTNWFVIGSTSTFIVPGGASELSLAILDRPGEYGDNTGEGFKVAVMVTPQPSFPTATLLPGLQVGGVPDTAPAAAALPRLDIDFYRVAPDKKTMTAAGYVSFAVTNTHVK